MTLVERFDSPPTEQQCQTMGLSPALGNSCVPHQPNQQPTRRHRPDLCNQLPVLNALQPPLQRFKLCFLRKNHWLAPLLSLPPCAATSTSFHSAGLSVHCSVGQNGFEEQRVRQEQEGGGGGVARLPRGGGGGPCCGQRPAHQPSLPVSGDKYGQSHGCNESLYNL